MCKDGTNLALLEAEKRDQKDHSSRLAWAKKVRPPISTKKLDVVEHTCGPYYMEGICKRVTVQTSPGKTQDPISKITKAKRARSIVQVASGRTEFKPQYHQRRRRKRRGRKRRRTKRRDNTEIPSE
jgi:hypothetical protein